MRLEFKQLQLEDREKLNKYFQEDRSRSCERTFACMYLWSRRYQMKYTILNDMLIVYYHHLKFFSYPIGAQEKLKDTMDLLMEWCQQENIPFRVGGITPEYHTIIEQLYPGKFQVEYNRDIFDYVYETEKLIQLSGKKYHGKKNHLNKFQKTYPNWSYETITDDNVEDCFQMALDWRRENGCEEDSEKNAELCVTMNSLRLMKELELIGGLIRVDGKVVAFSIGEPVSEDTMVVHIEKAYADVPGAYTIINQQFLEHEAASYRYVNREEDTGEPGLRKAKESYRPVFMVEKGMLTER